MVRDTVRYTDPIMAVLEKNIEWFNDYCKKDRAIVKDTVSYTDSIMAVYWRRI
jgi:hypothetical protein